MEDLKAIVLVVSAFLVGVVIYFAMKQRNDGPGESDTKQHQRSFAYETKKASSTQEEARCLDGRPLVTQNDWKQWWIWKGYTDALCGSLWKLESKIVEMDNPDSAATLSEWERMYAEVRDNCLRHGMWNRMIDDMKPFLPTPEQLLLEKKLLEGIRNEQKNALPDQVAYQEYSQKILEYIKSQPKHIARKSALITAVSEKSEEKRKLVTRVYRRMCKNNTIKEKQNESGHWEVKKSYSRKKAPEQEDQRISVFSPELYRMVDVSTEYKALITVNEPTNLSSTKGSCKFYSKSTGIEYITHLDSCTCPMYVRGGEPCKHMVKLAATLGYYKIKVQKSRP